MATETVRRWSAKADWTLAAAILAAKIASFFAGDDPAIILQLGIGAIAWIVLPAWMHSRIQPTIKRLANPAVREELSLTGMRSRDLFRECVDARMLSAAVPVVAVVLSGLLSAFVAAVFAGVFAFGELRLVGFVALPCFVAYWGIAERLCALNAPARIRVPGSVFWPLAALLAGIAGLGLAALSYVLGWNPLAVVVANWLSVAGCIAAGTLAAVRLSKARKSYFAE